MVIVGSVILPHGAMVFDGNPNVADGTPTSERIRAISVTQRHDCGVLFTSCSKAAEIVKKTCPDIIFLNTPHGICLRDAVGVYLNSTAKGNAEWNKNWSEFEVELKLDTQLADKFIEHLLSNGIAAEGITAFTKCEIPLRWGEVIPMWFLQDLMSTGGKEVKVVIFTNPVNKMRGPTLLPSRANIGRSIATFMRGLDQRVLYVVSGDLAHNHKTDCQNDLYLPDPHGHSLYHQRHCILMCVLKTGSKAFPLLQRKRRGNSSRRVQKSTQSNGMQPSPMMLSSGSLKPLPCRAPTIRVEYLVLVFCMVCCWPRLSREQDSRHTSCVVLLQPTMA